MIEMEKQTVLIVDDEKDLCELLAAEAEDLGFNTRTAFNGRDAYEIVRSGNVDIVISDIQMPGGNGMELLDKVKNMDCERPIILFMTGFSSVTLDEIYHRGAEAVFSKPIDYDEVFQKVRDLLMPFKERWSSRWDRSEGKGTIKLKVEGQASDLPPSEIFNVGRGGIFVGIEKNIPAKGKIVEFEIQFQQSPGEFLRGRGIVRWIRGSNSELRSGCGIEFLNLDWDSRKKLIALLQRRHSRAFIPRK